MTDINSSVDVDALIDAELSTGAEATPEPEAVEAPAEVETVNEENVETTDTPDKEPETEAEETDAEPDKEEAKEFDEDKDPWPTKAKKAIKRRDRDIGKLKARLEYLEQQQTQSTKDGVEKPAEAPKSDDFDNYDDFIKAQAEFAVDAANRDRATQEKQSIEDYQKQQFVQERSKALDVNSAEAAKVFHDFDDVAASVDMNGVAPHVKDVFLEAENGAYAFYGLVKEGLLDGLNNMSPTQAAMLVARYEDKALGIAKAAQEKTVTKTPAPQKPNKGTGASSKSALNRVAQTNNPKDVLDWMRN